MEGDEIRKMGQDQGKVQDEVNVKKKNLAGGRHGLIYIHFEKIPMAFGRKRIEGMWGGQHESREPSQGASAESLGEAVALPRGMGGVGKK